MTSLLNELQRGRLPLIELCGQEMTFSRDPRHKEPVGIYINGGVHR